jgi:hypothetical protein
MQKPETLTTFSRTESLQSKIIENNELCPPENGHSSPANSGHGHRLSQILYYSNGEDKMEPKFLKEIITQSVL